MAVAVLQDGILFRQPESMEVDDSQSTISSTTSFGNNLLGKGLPQISNSDNRDTTLSFGRPLVDLSTLSARPSSESPPIPPITNGANQHTSGVDAGNLGLQFGRSNLNLSSTTSSSRPNDQASVIQATSFDGKCFTLKRKSRTTITPSLNLDRTGPLKLLQTPIHRLMDEVLRAKKDQLNAKTDDTTCTAQSGSDKLWVDRYRPSKFTELLGDERVHRETLAWVKAWDTCVFGKQKNNRRKRQRDEEVNQYEDYYRRPREKLLLLSGPPGLGKTTLAGIIAKQAGYSVMEINASDARSGSVLDDRIRPALEAGSMIGNSKPVLLVIDEIDGATGAGENNWSFIQKLVDLTYDDSWRKKQGQGKNKSRSTKRPLLRPIICICNDLYASSLAKLRTVCKIVRFQRPSDVLLIKRLREICSFEGLRMDAQALSTLTRIGQGDMRACINALQFLNSRLHNRKDTNATEIDQAVLKNAIQGMKESETSVVSVLNDLFNLPTKNGFKALGLSEQEETDFVNRFVNRLSRSIDACGSQEKVAIGCFEHYSNLQHLHDLGKLGKAQRWLGAFDLLSAAVHADRDYGLMPYFSYCLIPFYTLFSERGGARVERPKTDWENFQRTKSHEEIYKTLANALHSPHNRTSRSSKVASDDAASDDGSAVDLRHLLTTPVLQLEFAPLLNRIITPPLKPMNQQIVRSDERLVLNRLVKIMTSLDLQYYLDKNEDGQVYRLEPPIEVFSTYDNKRASDVPVVRYATCQVVAAEIDRTLAQRKRETTQKARGKDKPIASLFRSHVKQAEEDEQPDDEPKREGQLMGFNAPGFELKMSDTLRNAKRLKLDAVEKQPTDFFGRPIKVPTVAAAASSDSSTAVAHGGTGVPAIKYKVSYKYTQGNSAAVRKPITISALL